MFLCILEFAQSLCNHTSNRSDIPRDICDSDQWPIDLTLVQLQMSETLFHVSTRSWSIWDVFKSCSIHIHIEESFTCAVKVCGCFRRFVIFGWLHQNPSHTVCAPIHIETFRIIRVITWKLWRGCDRIFYIQEKFSKFWRPDCERHWFLEKVLIKFPKRF